MYYNMTNKELLDAYNARVLVCTKNITRQMVRTLTV